MSSNVRVKVLVNSLFYSAYNVFATYTRIFSSVQHLVNEKFFLQSSF